MRVEVTIPSEQLHAAVEDAVRKHLGRQAPATPKLSYKLKEAAAATGLSVGYFRALIRAKKLKVITLGRTKLIPAAEIERLLTNTEKAKEQQWSTSEGTFGGLSLSGAVN